MSTFNVYLTMEGPIPSYSDTITRGSKCQYVYGAAPSQYFVLTTPPEEGRTQLPIAVIIHGGFWKQKYTIENSAIESLSPFFCSKGVAACMLEYRRCAADGPSGEPDDGGWPKTNDDIMAALRKLYDICAESESLLDPNKIFLVGHSAGGYLALWACLERNRQKLPFSPYFCLSLAPVCDLFEAVKRKYAMLLYLIYICGKYSFLYLFRLSDDGDAVEKYMNLSLDLNDECCVSTFASACILRQLPLANTPTLIVSGLADTDIPADMLDAFYLEVIKSNEGSVKVCS